MRLLSLLFATASTTIARVEHDGDVIDVDVHLPAEDALALLEVSDENVLTAAEANELTRLEQEFERITKQFFADPQGKARAQLELQETMLPLRAQRARSIVVEALAAAQKGG